MPSDVQSAGSGMVDLHQLCPVQGNVLQLSAHAMASMASQDDTATHQMAFSSLGRHALSQAALQTSRHAHNHQSSGGCKSSSNSRVRPSVYH